jgi:hypothetical protein
MSRINSKKCHKKLKLSQQLKKAAGTIALKHDSHFFIPANSIPHRPRSAPWRPAHHEDPSESDETETF